MNQNIMDIGKKDFFVGCNYWASYAGTAMWSDWRPDIVDMDLRRLSEEGLQVLRVFPLWPDFQPIERLYGGGGQKVEYRFGETVIPDDEAGRAGVSGVAMQRFKEFAEIASKYNLKLIVGLITGWMSGRLFVPPALLGRDILTDTTSIQWQVRFVKYFVKTFRNCEAVVAWDLGNECNCMQGKLSREDAWVWTSSIASAIKAMDSTRPLVSGMHSLTPTGTWTMQDQGEITDILTTHPYPFWTHYCDYDPVNTIRPQLHATAESLFYSNIGGKPCFAEEIGTMGPMIVNDKTAADFARSSMLSLWAHGCHGFLWWCANDQTELEHAPYDWFACERELGLLKTDGSPKPVLKEMGRLRRVLEELPMESLPPRVVDAVCIVNSEQDHWAVALSAFILSKQAGFDIEFQFDEQPLKEAPIYLVPCITGVRGVRRHRWKEILHRVSGGATLYVSMNDGYISEFEKLSGLSVKSRSRRVGEAEVAFQGALEGLALKFEGVLKWEMEPTRATALGSEKDGNAVFAKAEYGKGKVYFLGLPMEMNLIRRPGVFYHAEAEPFWRIYELVARNENKNRVIEKLHPLVGVTEHPIDEGNRIAVLINYTGEVLETPIRLDEGWRLEAVWYGDKPCGTGGELKCRIRANDAVVLKLNRK